MTPAPTPTPTPTPVFSIGEYVTRILDGKTGMVTAIQPYDGDFSYSVRISGEDWSGTAGAWTSAFQLHAHVESSSADCDGSYSMSTTYSLTLEERCDAFGDHAFRNRVLAAVINPNGYGSLDVSPFGAAWDEKTEEGYRHSEITWCSDVCAPATVRRDHRAEENGY